MSIVSLCRICSVNYKKKKSLELKISACYKPGTPGFFYTYFFITPLFFRVKSGITIHMEILEKVFGSAARVKVMRLFLLNKTKNFTSKEIAKRSRISPESTRKELRLLESVEFVKKRANGYTFNLSFKYTSEFEGLLVSSNTVDSAELGSQFKKVGRVKLLVVSGVFIKNKESRVDLLVVGDNIKKGKVEEEIRKLEAEMGVEMVYALFTTKEFIYRLNMYDKLIRDILDFPHQVIVETKELSTHTANSARKLV